MGNIANSSHNHAAFFAGSKFHKFLEMFPLCIRWSTSQMKNFVRPCVKCGQQLIPPAWLLVVFGMIDTTLSVLISCAVLIAITFRLAKNIFLAYVAMSAVLVMIAVAVRGVLFSILLILIPWRKAKRKLNEDDKKLVILNPYKKGVNISSVVYLIAAFIICITNATS